MFPIFGYPKIELWISKNRIRDILNSAGFLDILKYTDFRISKNELWIIQKSKNRYHKLGNIFGYPKVYFRIS